jgi:hypothetical protein
MSDVTEALPSEAQAITTPPEDGLGAFYQMYGRAMDEWVSVEWGLGLCFALATLMPIKLANAVFYSGRDFHVKRDLLTAALSESQLGIAEGPEIVKFIKACQKTAGHYHRVRTMLDNRRIMWNDATQEAELRAGDDWTSHNDEKIDYLVLGNIADNFEALHTIMVRTLSLTTTRNMYSPEKGLMMIEELPTAAMARPTLRNF